MATTVPREMIIEALTEANYKSWAECMKNYLKSKDLWEGIIVNCSESKSDHEPIQMNSSTEAAANLWKKRNAKALHAIQVSCGSKMFSCIIMKESAEAAWHYLASIHCGHDKHKTALQIQFESRDNQGIHEKDILHMSLYNAVIDGNLEETKRILEQHPEAVRAKISTDGGSALHYAVLYDHDHLVELLVNKMNDEDLELCAKCQNGANCQNGATALNLLATGRNVKMAEAMVKKNENLLHIQNSDGYIPVCTAALSGGSNKMLECLYKLTSDSWDGGSSNPNKQISKQAQKKNKNDTDDMLNRKSSAVTLLFILMNNENYDFTLKLLHRFPELAIATNDKRRICLNILAQKPSSFADRSQLSTWQRWIYDRLEVPDLARRGSNNDIEGHSGQSLRSTLSKKFGIDELYKSKIKHTQVKEILEIIFEQLKLVDSIEMLESLVMPAMFQAVEAGNVEFISEMLNFYPALLKSGTQSGCIFHKAVAQRQEDIWTLIYSLPLVMRYDIASMKDDIGNNLSHVAASFKPGLEGIPVPALQLYRELQSFKEVEKLLPSMLKEEKNEEGKTAETLFTEQHAGFAREGRRWMEEMATSCTVVATLIISVMFSGANQSWGKKMPLTAQIEYESGFHIFMIADALSVISSTLALLTFLSIFTTGYSQKEFLETLPQRFKMSLATLFLSIGTVMIAFGVLFFDKLSSAQKWGALAFSSLAMVPVVVFAGLHLPLVLELIKYACRSASNRTPKLLIQFPKDYGSPLKIRRRTWKDKYSQVVSRCWN